MSEERTKLIPSPGSVAVCPHCGGELEWENCGREMPPFEDWFVCFDCDWTCESVWSDEHESKIPSIPQNRQARVFMTAKRL